MNSAFIEFPYDLEPELGSKGQVKVVATVDGYEYRGSLAKMGEPCYQLVLPKAMSGHRKESGRHCPRRPETGGTTPGCRHPG